MAKSNRKVFIYGLTDSQGEIRYIGQTVSPKSRYEQHLQDSGGSPKGRWIQSMVQSGGKPGMVILNTSASKDASYHEKWWITLGVKRGWNLTNVANPTRRNVSFQDMFLETLKDDLQQFRVEHDPVLMITRRHIKIVAMYTKITIGLILGAAMAYAAYTAEYLATGVAYIALFYGLVSFIFTANLFFLWAWGLLPELGTRKFITMHVAPLLIIWLSRASVWWFGY